MDLTSLPPDKRKLCEEILNGEEEAIYENITNKTLTTFLGENELSNVQFRGLLFPDKKRTTGLIVCSLCEEQLTANVGNPWLSGGVKTEYSYKDMV